MKLRFGKYIYFRKRHEINVNAKHYEKLFRNLMYLCMKSSMRSA